MMIFAIDDEPKMLRLLHRAVEEAAPDAQILDFPLGTQAVRAIEEQKLQPDFVFTDIEMPGLDGLRMAVRLKQLAPAVKVVFVTGYSDYAVEAMKLHMNGYIMKPVTARRVREELQYNAPPQKPQPDGDRLRVRCFGYFEVFWHDKPLMFGRRQTKEFLAYLIYREGAACTSEEIAAALWEGETDMRAVKQRIRQLISDLRNSLAEIGMEKLLVRRSGQAAIVKDLLDCDYYRMLEGDMDEVNAYFGEFMTQYGWAKMAEDRLRFK